MSSSHGLGDTYRLQVNGSCRLCLSQDGLVSVEGACLELVQLRLKKYSKEVLHRD